MDNILGVGVDIESISRFTNLDIESDKNFLDKIFTKSELEFCFAKTNPAPHLAARFAAKEATFKALTVCGRANIPMNKLEIISRPDGVPEIVLNDDLKNLKIFLSLSHCEDKAIAFVLITRI